ncbi:hypothetical protein A3L12_01170 [Thermococcus sp. P6]|uniref:hypothetical protein n=1 Tax=Thermococcus sp. P6 TaxID=122420 RepID=UPI000B59E4D6|nr:hypothetical protein [Thermococcus sp. P6]ASJ10006.1 hypothetical protein A3L12_01170 [Thermococcus sp. P6]
MRVPYVLFETNTGRYGLDAYFSMRVDAVERRATLIRRADDLRRVEERPSTALLDGESVGEYLRSLFLTLYELSGERFNERMGHMRRWNVWRMIGIPTGHWRHLRKDDELARRNREALLALEIMRKVLGVKHPGDLEKAPVRPLGYALLEVEFRDGKASDPVYRELLRIDAGAGMALPWLEIKTGKGITPPRRASRPRNDPSQPR